MAASTWSGRENDLPLMSNTSQVLVRHYILDLFCDLEQQIFYGSITLFLDLSRRGEDKRVFSIQEFQNTLKKDEEKLSNRESHDSEKSKESNRETSLKSPFELILDCCEIDVENVEKIDCTKADIRALFQESHRDSAAKLRAISRLSGQVINHRTDQWSLRISDPQVMKPGEFPPVVRVTYQTQRKGRSLRWVIDQDGNPCVYTAGMWINNRSFLPCQEYGSLSTWQAFIRAPQYWQVFMTGDEVAQCSKCERGTVEFEYGSSMPMPSFTLAIAVGRWDIAVIHDSQIGVECCHGTSTVCEEFCPLKPVSEKEQTSTPLHLKRTCEHPNPCHIPFSDSSCINCRIVAPPSKIRAAIEEFAPTFPKYCTVVQKILGPCPFRRMDIVLYPPSSQDMAMCNPNLLFISQSVLAGDHTMCVRLGHELSHYWFGLLIGARDWTEEWLSEGFATYVEDFVQADVLAELDEQRREDQEELTAYIRYKALAAEVAHTSTELQTLRPNQGQEIEASTENDSVMFVKNGNNPNKLFTQVHYLKGYFLLQWLGKQVGVRSFLTIFRDYIVKHHGEMVTSKDFMDLVFAKFPELTSKAYTVESVCTEWLDGTGLPNALQNFHPSNSNRLYCDILSEASKWKSRDRSNRRMHSLGKRPKLNKDESQEFSLAQMILFLDELLQKKSFQATTLRQLNNCYQFSSRNAEIHHRWLELVVKHLFVPSYGDLELFLLHHQAMGVYLYGEMMISRCPKLRDIAHRCFSNVKDDMETTTRNMVQTMLFGN